jgi:hypothetical protein
VAAGRWATALRSTAVHGPVILAVPGTPSLSQAAAVGRCLAEGPNSTLVVGSRWAVAVGSCSAVLEGSCSAVVVGSRSAVLEVEGSCSAAVVVGGSCCCSVTEALNRLHKNPVAAGRLKLNSMPAAGSSCCLGLGSEDLPSFGAEALTVDEGRCSTATSLASAGTGKNHRSLVVPTVVAGNRRRAA